MKNLVLKKIYIYFYSKLATFYHFKNFSDFLQEILNFGQKDVLKIFTILPASYSKFDIIWWLKNWIQNRAILLLARIV